MQAEREAKRSAAVDHFAWPVVAGMVGPFLLALLSWPFQEDGFTPGDLVKGGEMHLATAAMLLASAPKTVGAASTSGWGRLPWSLLAVFTSLLMLAAVFVWANLAPKTELENAEWRMAWEGGLYAMVIAAFFSSLLVWKAS